MLSTAIWAALLAFGGSLVSAQSNSTILPSRTIYTFPNTTYYDIENVAVRSNGNILLNLLTEPSVYTLDPSSASPNATLVHTFPNATKLDGITEYRPDVFAFVVGDAINTTTSTYTIWSLDFNSSPPTPCKIAEVPTAKGLNGMTTLTGTYSDTLLIADAKLGAVFSLDVTTGKSHVALEDSHFLPTTSIAFGLNGIHVYDQTLYFSTSANYTFGSVPISANGTFLKSELKVIATQINSTSNVDFDDFAVQSGGKYAWLCDHSEDLVKVDLATGEQVVVVTGLTQPTAAAFGRGNGGVETNVLYVVTMGSKGPPIVSGEIVAVYT